MRCLAPAFAAALLALPAWADPLPSIVPTHDVSGTYQLTDPDGTQLIAVEYSVNANVLRLAPQSGGNYILYDFNANDAKMVLPSLQHYYEQPDIVSKIQKIEADINSGRSNAVAGGTETIGGETCTDYTPASNADGTVICITSDGIILKLVSPNGTSFVAQSFAGNLVPPTDLQVPPGYTELTAPP
jgi:hypothetical protein